MASRRGFADEKSPKPATGPNQDVLGSVSQEAADVGKVTGEEEPDLSQGTPVQEVWFHCAVVKMEAHDISPPQKDHLLTNSRFSNATKKVKRKPRK